MDEKKKKYIFKKRIQGLLRAGIVALAFLMQIVTTILLAFLLQRGALVVYLVIEFIGILVVFGLVNDGETYQHYWILIAMVVPVAAVFLYFMWGRKRTNSKNYRRFREVEGKMFDMLRTDDKTIKEMEEIHPNKVLINRFLSKEGFPLYKNTDVKFYPVGEKMRPDFFEDIRNAKSFVFVEYFIISDGVFWDELYEILKQKVKEGVDVRLLMDDFGCIFINDRKFRADLKANGIKFEVFSPIHKEVAHLSCNYRNHQKITVIDGNIGYTGGLNIADEYVNEIDRFGYWKDSAVRLTGEGVYSLTCFFLEMWEITQKQDSIDYAKYKPTLKLEQGGYVQPFSDGPANNPRNPAEKTYTHLINKARDYIYITTPYLVLDKRMADDLCRAAESGVDVRIITPHRYDKWYVYMVTISNYGYLIKKGVRIYEFQPGFIHAKNVISDDELALCGTINMDYRSFNLHYECGVLMSRSPVIQDMKQDFLSTLEVCNEIHYDKWCARPLWQRFMQAVLRLFSPLL